MYQNKQEKERKKRNQHLKSITNPVNKSPTHRAHSRHNARAPRVCFHGKRLHPQGGLVGPLKGTDIPSSLETMVRGKSKPNLERGKSCQSMSCLCLSQPGALRTEVLSDNRADGAWGCAPHMSAMTSTWALNSWPAPQALTQQPPTECREPQARSPVNGAAFSLSQGYCHREGCWTEKPRITMMKWWPPALRKGTYEEKNSDMETAQIPVHCRCHKASNIVLDSCSPMGKHSTQKTKEGRVNTAGQL